MRRHARSILRILALVAASVGCLNRMNVTERSLSRLGDSDGIAFGRIAVAAPADLDADIQTNDGFLVTADGAVVKLEAASDGSSYRFRLPPSGAFVFALPEGEYRITHWMGLVTDGPLERIEAHLGLDVLFVVRRGAAAAVGEILFDGTALAVRPAGEAESNEFRAELPSFAGSLIPAPARAISASPPVRILRYVPAGAGGDDSSM